MKENKLIQVSTLNDLMLGDYEGSVKIKELMKHADTGIGTFDGLEGKIAGYLEKIWTDGMTKAIESL